MTTLETQFMNELLTEAYGGTLFTGDINPAGMTKAQKSGVISSLCKKNIIVSSNDGYNQIGIVVDPTDRIFGVEYEISKSLVEEAIARAE